MADLVAFDFTSVDPQAGLRAVRTQLNRQGFIERSILTRLDDRAEYGRSPWWFQRSDVTTFETHQACGLWTNGAALSTVSGGTNTMVAVPFVWNGPFTTDLIEFEVTTGAGAGGKARAGIYDSANDANGTPYPTSLVTQTAEFDVTGTGVKSTSISVTLTPGRLYFATYNNGTAAATVRAIPLTNVYPFLGLPSTLGTAAQYAYTVASTYDSSTLPASYPTGATAVTAAAVPAIFLRASGVTTVYRDFFAFSPSLPGYFLRRVKLMSAASTSLTTGSYALVQPSVRTTNGVTPLATFDTRSNRLTAGSPYYLIGANGELDQNLAVDSEYEIRVTYVGVMSASLRDITVQTDIAFSGATS